MNDFPDVGEFRRRSFWDYQCYGKLLASLRRIEDAEGALRRSLAILEKLSADFPGVQRYRAELTEGWYELGILFERTNKSSEAAKAFRNAIDLAEKLSVEDPSSPEHPPC